MRLAANFGPALAELGLLRYRLANSGTVLHLIGQQAKARAEHEIRTGKHDPDGIKWAPWADGTTRSRSRRGTAGQGLLWDTGTLLHSIRVQVGASDVVIGTETEYAHYLHDGTSRMPARQILGWGDAAEKDAEKTMIDYLQGQP